MYLCSTSNLLEPQPFFLLQLQRLEWLQSYSHLLIAKSKCNAQCCRFQLGIVPEMYSQKACHVACRNALFFLCQQTSLVIARCIRTV